MAANMDGIMDWDLSSSTRTNKAKTKKRDSGNLVEGTRARITEAHGVQAFAKNGTMLREPSFFL